MVLGTSLLNTQPYKVRIKGKVEQPGKGVAPYYTVAVEKGALGSPSSMVANFTFYLASLLFLNKDSIKYPTQVDMALKKLKSHFNL